MEEVKGANSSNGTGPSVLLADDDEPNRAREVRMLCKLGCRVTVVRNGGHVLRALELRSFDIILMDCRLMVLDGLQTSREIRHMGGALSSIPIIAMSPSAMLSIQRKCLEAGMQEKMRKPVCLREMRATLLRWLPREIAKSLRPSSPSRGSNGTRRRTRPVAADPVSERLEELSCSLRDHSFLKEQLRHLRESATQRWLEIDAACHSGDLASHRSAV
jgi:CheY-like chemotaxis protein